MRMGSMSLVFLSLHAIPEEGKAFIRYISAHLPKVKETASCDISPTGLKVSSVRHGWKGCYFLNKRQLLFLCNGRWLSKHPAFLTHHANKSPKDCMNSLPKDSDPRTGLLMYRGLRSIRKNDVSWNMRSITAARYLSFDLSIIIIIIII